VDLKAVKALLSVSPDVIELDNDLTDNNTLDIDGVIVIELLIALDKSVNLVTAGLLVTLDVILLLAISCLTNDTEELAESTILLTDNKTLAILSDEVMLSVKFLATLDNADIEGVAVTDGVKFLFELYCLDIESEDMADEIVSLNPVSDPAIATDVLILSNTVLLLLSSLAIISLILTEPVILAATSKPT
jgi:hypothetical protein